MTKLTQSAFAALARSHFGFLSEDEPVFDRRRTAFFATYASSPWTVVLECWEDADFLEVTAVHAGDRLPIASQHTGRQWTEKRLERAFAEHAADLRTWLGARRMKRIVDPATTFVPTAERVFGRAVEVVDDGRAVLLRDRDQAVKLSLEAGERELWVSRIRLVDGDLPRVFAYSPEHEHRIREIEIETSIEDALREARKALHD
jgi:hypothetical protein